MNDILLSPELKYGYMRILSLTTSQSPKLIPKADLKYYVHIYILIFFCVSVNIKESKKMGFLLYFKILLGQCDGRG